MISLIKRLADIHFKQDASDRLVYVPVSPKGKCYFVDSKSDEEKIRAFVCMYRIPSALISILMTPIVMVPALILEDYGQLTPRGHRLTVALGISGYFWLSLVVLELMLWFVYRAMVPGLTASLSEVEPENKVALRAVATQHPGKQRVMLLCILAGLVVLGLVLVALTGYSN